MLNSGTITYNSGSQLFEVRGSHTYVADGNYTITVQLHHEATTPPAAVTDSATIADAVPTVALSGASSTPEGSSYTLTLGPVVDSGETAGETGGLDKVHYYVISWGDGAFVFVSPGAATGNGMGGNTSNLMAMPGSRQFNHAYADGIVPPSTVTISVDLETDDAYWSAVGSKNVVVNNVNPTAVVQASTPINEGVSGLVFFTGQFDPSVPDTNAGFHYAYDYNNDGIFEVGDGTYGGSGTNSSQSVPAAYLPAGNDTIRMRIIDKDNGYTDYTKVIHVNNVVPSLNLGSGSFNASTGDPFSYNVSFTDPGSGDGETYTATIDYGDGTIHSGIPVTAGTPFDIGSVGGGHIYSTTGDKTVMVTVFDTGGGSSSGNINAHVSLGVLHVTNFVQDTSGFNVTFDRAVNASVLNLYDGITLSNQTNLLGAADVTLVGQSTGLVHGSLVWNASTNTATFVANSILSGGIYTRLNGQLPADNYTVTLVSGANGWVDTGGGSLNGGTNYTTTFTVTSSSAVVLSMPSFARAANQTLSVADNGTAGSAGNPATGWPIRINNGMGVTAVDFTLTYDPTLLTIGGVSNPGLPANWGITFNNSTPGTLLVTVSGPTSLPAGAMDLVKILGTIPGSAPYGASGVLRLTNIRVNEGSVAAVSNNEAIDKAAYFGDTNGNRSMFLDLYDAFDTSRVVVNLDNGFYAYPLTDPMIIADTTGDGTLSGQDASLISQVEVGASVPQIPPVPVTAPTSTATIDPTVAIPAGVVGVRGQTASSNVAITGSEPTDNLATGGFVINYPTSFVSVATDASNYATGVTISSFMASQGFQLIAYSPNPGQVNVGFYNGNGQFLNDGTPPLFTVPFNVQPTAPNGVAPITFGSGSNLNSGGLVLTPVDGSVVILGYNWLGGTGSAGHVNDWSVTTNWDANIDPNVAGSTVIFGNSGATGTAVLNAGNRTIGTMDFNSSTPTTITTTLADAGTLTFDNGASDAAINVSGSGHNITSLVGVMLNSNLDIAVNSNGDTLAIAGNIIDGANGPKGLTKSGAGKLTLSGVNTYGGDTAVTGGVLKVTSASALPDGGNLAVGAAALTMFSSTVPEAPIAAASAVSKAESSTSSHPLVNSVATTLQAQPWIIKNAAATVANLPNIGATVKAHDAALKTWTPNQSAKNSSWLAAWYDVNNQGDSKNRSAAIAAVDEAIIRYSK